MQRTRVPAYKVIHLRRDTTPAREEGHAFGKFESSINDVASLVYHECWRKPVTVLILLLEIYGHLKRLQIICVKFLNSVCDKHVLLYTLARVPEIAGLCVCVGANTKGPDTEYEQCGYKRGGNESRSH